MELKSRLTRPREQFPNEKSSVTHTTIRFANQDDLLSDGVKTPVDLTATKTRIGVQLRDAFSIDHLSGVGVAAMRFRWAVMENLGNEKVTIAK